MKLLVNLRKKDKNFQRVFVKTIDNKNLISEETSKVITLTTLDRNRMIKLNTIAK